MCSGFRSLTADLAPVAPRLPRALMDQFKRLGVSLQKLTQSVVELEMREIDASHIIYRSRRSLYVGFGQSSECFAVIPRGRISGTGGGLGLSKCESRGDKHHAGRNCARHSHVTSLTRFYFKSLCPINGEMWNLSNFPEPRAIL